MKTSDVKSQNKKNIVSSELHQCYLGHKEIEEVGVASAVISTFPHLSESTQKMLLNQSYWSRDLHFRCIFHVQNICHH